MWRSAKISIVKLVAVLCCMAQGVSAMPHHHHGDASAACLVLSHCLQHGSSDGCGDCDEAPVGEAGCEGHSHDASGACCTVEVDLLVPGDRDDSVPAPLPSSHDGLACLHTCCRFAADHELRARITLRASLDGVPPEVPILHTDYIAAAIPPRAPSFTA